jgi:hypothetical protein
MDSILYGIVIPSVCVFPSLIYAYQYYRKNKSSKLEFILTNVMAVLLVFTLYLAQVCLK